MRKLVRFALPVFLIAPTALLTQNKTGMTGNFGGADAAASDLFNPASSVAQSVIQNPTSSKGVNITMNVFNPTLFPGADLGAQMSAVQRQMNGQCGMIQIPPGRYTWSTPVTMLPCQHINGFGAIVNVTSTGATPFLTLTGVPSYGSSRVYAIGNLENITFSGSTGPGTFSAPATSVGIQMGASKNSTSAAFLVNMRDVHIRNFGTGILYGNAFQNATFGGSIENNFNGVGFIDDAIGVENLGFYGVEFLGNIHSDIYEPWIDEYVELNLIGDSFDHDNPETTSQTIPVVNAHGLTHISGGHFEGPMIPFIQFGVPGAMGGAGGPGQPIADISGVGFNLIPFSGTTTKSFISVYGANSKLNLGQGNVFGTNGLIPSSIVYWAANGSDSTFHALPCTPMNQGNGMNISIISGPVLPGNYSYPLFDFFGDTLAIVTSYRTEARNGLHATGFPGPAEQGAWLGWNRAGQGETDFVNNPGTAGGGWRWWSSNANGSVVTQVASMDSLGNLAPATENPAAITVTAHVNAGAGMQHKRGPVGCNTAATAGATCTSPVQTWNVPFTDPNYTLSCTLSAPTGAPVISTVSKSAAGFDLTIAALTSAAASGTYNCIAMHD